MASQRQGAETIHSGIMQRERAEFDELLRREKEQVHRIRSEAAEMGNQLLGQLTAERTKCQEMEMVAEYHVKSSNMEYVSEMQKVCAARDQLAHALQSAIIALERCGQEVALRDAMLRNGDAQTGDIVQELAELRNFKVHFGQWVNERLAVERAALATAQQKILELGKEVDDLRATDVRTTTQMYEISDELGQARARIASRAQENMALRESCPLDRTTVLLGRKSRPSCCPLRPKGKTMS